MLIFPPVNFMLPSFHKKFSDKVWDELDRIQPREVIICKELEETENFADKKKQMNFVYNYSRIEKVKAAYNFLLEHFKTNSLSGFGCEDKPAAILAAGEIINFLKDTQKRTLEHINRITTYNLTDYMVLDSATRYNLELTSTIRGNKHKGSLLNVLDQTITSMGGRLIKKMD